MAGAHLLQYGGAVQRNVSLVTDDRLDDDAVSHHETSPVHQHRGPDAAPGTHQLGTALRRTVIPTRQLRHVAASCPNHTHPATLQLVKLLRTENMTWTSVLSNSYLRSWQYII